MKKLCLVNPNFESMVLPVVPFEVTDTLPLHLRVILSKQIREVFKLRREYRDTPLQQTALDALLDKWWSNHWTMIKAASKRPEWSWDDLALVHNKSVDIKPQFVKAKRNLKYFLRGANTRSALSPTLNENPRDYYCDSSLRIRSLFTIMEEVYDLIAFEGLSEKSTQHTSVLTVATVNKCKEFCAEHNPLVEFTIGNKTVRYPKFKTVFKDGIGKLPESLFKSVQEHASAFNDFAELVYDNKDLFKAELLKYLGCCQTTTSFGPESGPAKTTIVNKMITLYFQFVSCNPELPFFNSPSVQSLNDSFTKLTSTNYRWISNDDFKHRAEGQEGYTLSIYGSYNQMLTRILEEVNGTTSTEHFVVSYHPCDMITCSLGYNWSSCQSFINVLDNFPSKYGASGNGTSNYSGAYHGGNFGFLTGNGYVVYIPYKNEAPLFLTAKLKRMLMWTNNNLTSMRQNYFYPGKPTDSDSIALASSIRVYLQNVYASYNGTKGTADWKAYSSANNVSFVFESCRRQYFRGYNDPIYKISAVKDRSNLELNLMYNEAIPILNNSFDVDNPSFVCHDSRFCFSTKGPGAILADNSGVASDEVVTLLALDKNSKEVSTFKYETLIINNDLVVTLDWYKQNVDALTYVDGKLLFKSKKYKSHSGIKYTIELPPNVKACKHCGELFEEDLLVDGYCLACAVHNADLDIIKVRDSFLNKELALEFTPSTLSKFFELLPADTSLTWRSGKRLQDFIPTLQDSVLVVEGSYVVLKTKAKNSLPIYNLSTTLKGE